MEGPFPPDSWKTPGGAGSFDQLGPVPFLSVRGNIDSNKCVLHTLVLNMYVCICMYMIEREKETRETAGESQSHNDSDGVSES